MAGRGGEEPSIGYAGIAASNAAPNIPGPNDYYKPEFAYEDNSMIGPDHRRQSLRDAAENIHGGGFMGNLGRGIGSLLGFAKEMTVMPGGNMGVNNSWNPGVLAGLAPGPIGLLAGPAAQWGWNKAGLPKPNWDYDPLEGKRLSDQIGPAQLGGLY